MSWIRRLYDGSEHAWKNIPIFYIKKHSDNIFYPNLELIPNNNMPTFYKNIIKYWINISKCNPVTINSITAQRLQFNTYIKIGNTPISWKFAGVNFVNDMLGNTGDFLDWQNFKSKYNLENSDFFRWRQLIGAVPRDWKFILERDKNERTLTFEPEQHILFITRMLILNRLTCKELYNKMVLSLKENPTTETRIQEILSTQDIDWQNVYTLIRNVTIDNYSRQFHFKLTHNILYLNKILHRMGLADSSECPFCHDEDETVLHLFSECRSTLSLWSQLNAYFSNNLELPNLTPQSAFFGFCTISENKMILNQILITFKITIYKSRDDGSCNIFKIISKIKLIKKIEDNITLNDERKRVFNDNKWSEICSLLS